MHTYLYECLHVYMYEIITVYKDIISKFREAPY